MGNEPDSSALPKLQFKMLQAGFTQLSSTPSSCLSHHFIPDLTHPVLCGSNATRQNKQPNHTERFPLLHMRKEEQQIPAECDSLVSSGAVLLMAFLLRKVSTVVEELFINLELLPTSKPSSLEHQFLFPRKAQQPRTNPAAP